MTLQIQGARGACDTSSPCHWSHCAILLGSGEFRPSCPWIPQDCHNEPVYGVTMWAHGSSTWASEKADNRNRTWVSGMPGENSATEPPSHRLSLFQFFCIRKFAKVFSGLWQVSKTSAVERLKDIPKSSCARMKQGPEGQAGSHAIKMASLSKHWDL
ncbi:uncharacterized protein LOC143679233 isoform X1 [Tamandua tetradactyla]|uniref:uncharacterized protein LOC143679233 isoform X1 n=1 Tax=Tamandua tetradactyla TaxID=48850 RepID=UPI00405489C2